MVIKEHKAKAREREPTPAGRWWWGYVVAVAGSVAAALVRWGLGREVAELPIYITFYPVVFVAAIIGGARPGLLATALSLLAAKLLFMEPVGKLGPATIGQAVSMALFIAINVGIVLLAGRLRTQSEALRESEARLQMAHLAADIGAFEWNVQTGVNTWAPELEAMYGLKPGEFARTEPAWEQLVHPEDRAKAVAAVERAFQTFQPEEGEWRVVWPDGTIHWLVGRFQAFKDCAGKPLRLVGVNIEITHRKEAEETLRQSEERLRQFIDEAPAAIAMFDTQMRYLAASRQWLTNFHLPNQSLVGRSHYELFPELPERWKQVHQRCLAGAVERADEDLFERADGRRQWVRWEVRPWYAAPDIIGGLLIFSEEITARVEALQALRESEEHFRTMANAIPQLAWIARPDGYIFWYNRRSLEYTGATLEQLEGWGWQSVVHPRTLPRVLERWQHSIATGNPYDNLEAQLRGGDGRFRPFITRVVPLKDHEGRVVLWFGTHTDITELRERERALSRQARLIDLAPAATLVRRPDGTITFWSQGAERLYGWSRQEALGRRTNDLLRTEFSEPLESIVAKLRGGGTWSGELRHYTRNGRQVVVQSYWLAERNDNGEVEELLESNTDITERKRLQEHLEEVVQKRTAKLHEAMAELEHMSYSMVHDMRAPLRAMQGFAGMMQEECADCRRPPGLDYLRRIRESSNRLDRLVTDALNYNKVVRENLPVTPVQLGTLLRGVANSYPNLHPPAADITIEFETLVVLGNESLLTQCFGNLLDNAVKFVASGVHPCVRVWAEPVPSLQSRDSSFEPEAKGEAATITQHGTRNPQLAPGLTLPESAPSPPSPSVRIWIADNGIGIPQEARERIFRMFQRMHRESEYPGTGIGLTIVKKAVERMNGRVGLESEPGQGSKFWVELPRAVKAQNQEPLREAA